MIFRNLTADGDWTFGKGLNDYLRENRAIGMNIRTRCLSWLNDCFFAMEEGIDWQNRMSLKNQQDLLKAELKNTVLKSEGVTAINSLDVIVNRRGFTALFDVETIFSKSYQDSIEVALNA